MEQALLKPGTRKIAIVGFTEHWAQAPFESDDWTVWCMNDFWRIAGDRWRHADAWFDMHRPAERHTKPGALEWVAKWDRPYVTPEQPDGHAPNPVVFPRDDVLKVFDTGYYTNTVAWLIGLAALLLWEAHSEWAQAKAAGREDADELRPVIGVYGVDMAADGEYMSQRPSCEWLLGLAAGAGFAIELAVGSDLLKAAEQYGYGDGALATKISFRRQLLTERSQQLSAQRQAKAAELAAIDNGLAEIRGALSELGYFASRWTQKAANSTRDETS